MGTNNPQNPPTHERPLKNGPNVTIKGHTCELKGLEEVCPLIKHVPMSQKWVKIKSTMVQGLKIPSNQLPRARKWTKQEVTTSMCVTSPHTCGTSKVVLPFEVKGKKL
jgi:hypothetical protein